MANVMSRITLACALVLLVQQASAETELEDQTGFSVRLTSALLINTRFRHLI